MMYPRFIRIRHHYDPKIIENSRAGLFHARALELVRESVGFRRKMGQTGQRAVGQRYSRADLPQWNPHPPWLLGDV